jgi:hypothetical protein
MLPFGREEERRSLLASEEEWKRVFETSTLVLYASPPTKFLKDGRVYSISFQKSGSVIALSNHAAVVKFELIRGLIRRSIAWTSQAGDDVDGQVESEAM